MFKNVERKLYLPGLGESVEMEMIIYYYFLKSQGQFLFKQDHILLIVASLVSQAMKHLF